MKGKGKKPKAFMRLAGSIEGPPDLSSRRGFSTRAEKDSDRPVARKTAKEKKTE